MLLGVEIPLLNADEKVTALVKEIEQGLAYLALPSHLIPKILRPLPASEPFHYIPALKKHLIDKALLHLYSDFPLPENTSVVLFTWVIGDGLGDYFAQLETARVLKQQFPQLPLALITLLHEPARQPEPFTDAPHFFARYTDTSGRWETIVCDPLSAEIKTYLSQASLILQIPTLYPNTAALLAEFPNAKHECVGEFGWIHTPHFHPLTPHRCMGLHPLEKGIFIKNLSPMEFDANRIQNKRLIRCLLDRKETTTYTATHRFNLAYTFTPDGFYLYVHALLTMCTKHPSETIDICFFHLGHLIENKIRFESLFQHLGISQAIVYYRDSISYIPIQPSGKTIRFIHTDPLTHDDFLTLMTMTRDLIGCRGDGSISEAIATGIPFFPDPPPHEHNFLKDLIALGEQRLTPFPHAVSFLKLWLSDLPLDARGEALGLALQHTDIRPAFAYLSALISQEYNGNTTLCHLVSRALCHHANPHINILEQCIVDEFLFGSQTAQTTLAEVSELL